MRNRHHRPHVCERRNQAVSHVIKRDYLLHKPAAASASKRFFDRQVIPVMIDAAAGADMAVAGWARQVRRSPGPAMCVAVGTGLVLSMLTLRRRV